MALFTIARRKYLNRIFTVDELSAMVEMLRLWRLEKSPSCESQVRIDVECRISWFPRPQRETILNALRPRLLHANIDVSDPDEIELVSCTQSLTDETDLSLWRECLAEPLLKHACVMLRITFVGPLRSPGGSGGNGNTTFVLFGSPLDGAFLSKAIWGFDKPVEERLRRLTDWDQQNRLLEAFEFYLRQCGVGPRASAASLAATQFFNAKSQIFISSRASAVVVWIMRRLVELPDEHGLAAFLRRLGLPLLFAAVLITVSLAATLPLEAMVVLLVIAGVCLWAALRVFLNKFRQVRRHYVAMRNALGIVHTQPVVFESADLSAEKSPCFLKLCQELETMGAIRVCDFKITTGNGVFDAQRMFRLGAHSAMVGVVRKYKTLEHFPGLPVVRLMTRFEDGWIHGTVNQPVYRKSHFPGYSGRCLPERGGMDETVALHVRHVDRLIDSGKRPSPPPATPQQAFEQMEKDHALGNKLWKKFPYSWGDALHDAFKYCRREYLRD